MINCEWCFQCCGDHIPVLPEELKKIAKYCKENKIVPEWGKWKEYCRYLCDRWRCTIYPVRPGICKFYGMVGNTYMECPRKEKDCIWSVEFDIWAKQWQREWKHYL